MKRIRCPRPPLTLDYDVAVIGAGVIGLACAERLSRDGRSVIIIERHASFGLETSSHNSEVVHAGMYYPTGSLKARLCVAGNALLRAYCERHRVALAPVGKFIVAITDEEETKLDEILARGAANGVIGLERVGRRFLAEHEPHVMATAALFSPNTAIVDSHGFMASLLADARTNGCDVAFRHRVVGAAPCRVGYALRVQDDQGETSSLSANIVINAAGLCSDDVAALLGIDVDAAGYRLTYVKGRYFRVHRRGFVKHLVYPVPPPRLIGLGVHVTVDLQGGAKLGPDTDVLPDRRIDYSVPESLREAFHRAASRYLRGLALDDLEPDQAGIRPKLNLSAREAADFIVAEESARGFAGWVNLIGIESPGLTASLALAEEVRTLVG